MKQLVLHRRFDYLYAVCVCLNVGVGVSKVDESEGITQGRYSGGVALLWRSELSKHIRQIKLGVN